MENGNGTIWLTDSDEDDNLYLVVNFEFTG